MLLPAPFEPFGAYFVVLSISTHLGVRWTVEFHHFFGPPEGLFAAPTFMITTISLAYNGSHRVIADSIRCCVVVVACFVVVVQFYPPEGPLDY